MATDSSVRGGFPAIVRGSRYPWGLRVRGSLMLALGMALALPSEAAGPDCARATQDLERAQQTLSRAMRDADTQGAAYAACMEKGAACASQKAAYDAALSAKGKAVAGHKAASSRQKDACQ